MKKSATQNQDLQASRANTLSVSCWLFVPGNLLSDTLLGVDYRVLVFRRYLNGLKDARCTAAPKAPQPTPTHDLHSVQRVGLLPNHYRVAADQNLGGIVVDCARITAYPEVGRVPRLASSQPSVAGRKSGSGKLSANF